MLRQEDPPPASDTQAAAQTRVTPEELAHAIASLEARRLDAERLQAGTIPIGEAVRELNLDATPEEVLAEVRAQREAQAAPPPPQSTQTDAQTPPTPPLASVPPLHRTVTDALRQAAIAAAPGLKQAALAASPALKHGMNALSQHVKQPKQEKRSRRRRPWAVIGIIFAVGAIVDGAIVVDNLHSLPHSHISVQATPQARYLSTVPDGHTVYADTTAVQSIAHGADSSTIAVQDNAPLDNGWALVRHDKHWYVRGYVLEDASLGTGAVKVYNQHNAGVLDGKREQDVTLRLDNSTLTDTNAGDDWIEIDLGSVHPDPYTHEDW